MLLDDDFFLRKLNTLRLFSYPRYRGCSNLVFGYFVGSRGAGCILQGCSGQLDHKFILIQINISNSKQSQK